MSDPKPILVWGNPPKASFGGRRYAHQAVVEALKERPGEWACVRRSPTRPPVDRIAHALRGKGYAQIAKPFRLEAVTRATSAGDYGVWARVVEVSDAQNRDRPVARW